MKKINLLFYILAGMSLLSFFSCASKSEKNLESESLISIELKSNPTTGSSWKAEIADEKIAILKSDEYVQDKAEPGMTGVGGTQTLTFKILKEGKAQINLVYGQQWKGGAIFEKRTILLSADKNLRGKIETLDSEITNYVASGEMILAEAAYLPEGSQVEFSTNDIYEQNGVFYVDMKEIVEAAKSLFKNQNEVQKGDIFLDTSNKIVMFFGNQTYPEIKGAKIGHINNSEYLVPEILQKNRTVRLVKSLN